MNLEFDMTIQIICVSLAVIILFAAWLIYFVNKKSYMLQTPMPKNPLPCQPDDFHLAYENVIFTAVDGTPIKGWFIPSLNEYSDETIIMCHGRGSNKGELLQRTHFLSDNYNLLYFDFRGSGESGGNMSTIGYLETRDFDAAYKFLKDSRDGYADRIAVFGSSVGASVAIYGAAKYPEIKGIALDSAFLSLHNVVRNWCRSNMRIFVPFVSLAISFLRRRLKTDPENYSPKFNAGKLSCPALFIFGDNDRLIPAADRDELFRICGSTEKEIFVINGATHTKCAETGGVLYRNKISDFFAKIFPARESKSAEHSDMPDSESNYVNSPKISSSETLPDNGGNDNKSASKQKKNKKNKKNR